MTALIARLHVLAMLFSSFATLNATIAQSTDHQWRPGTTGSYSTREELARLPQLNVVESASSPSDEEVVDPADEADLPRLMRPLSGVTATITDDPEDLPKDRSMDVFGGSDGTSIVRATSVHPFHWEAADLFHNPLYFDDIPLENYGQTNHPLLQPVISGGRFFGTLPLLPYKIGRDLPYSCVSVLGKDRSGPCGPYYRQRLPWSTRGALFEAAAVTTAILGVP